MNTDAAGKVKVTLSVGYKMKTKFRLPNRGNVKLRKQA